MSPTYICKIIKGKSKALGLEKCESWEWVNLNHLPKNILLGHLQGISLLKNGKDIEDIIKHISKC